MGGIFGFGKKATVHVATDKQHYLPGEVVQVSVKVQGTKDLAIQGGRVELWLHQEYQVDGARPR